MTHVLVVEDDPLLAFDLAEQLVSAGFSVAGPAHSVTEGLTLLAEEDCDAGVLDVNLGHGETSEAVAAELVRRRIPFVTLSGYSSDQHPPMLRAAPLLSKPVRIAQLITRLRQLANGRADGRPGVELQAGPQAK